MLTFFIYAKILKFFIIFNYITVAILHGIFEFANIFFKNAVKKNPAPSLSQMQEVC